MVAARIDIDSQRVADYCRRRQIRRLALFGSVLRDDFGPGSDVDVLIEFEPQACVAWEFITIQDELSSLFGRRVDLLTPGSVRPAYRDSILSSAVNIYAAD